MRRIVRAGLLVAIVSSGGAARSEAPRACGEVISPAAAQQVFDRLRLQAGADRCTLSDVQTEDTRMKVRWSKSGEPLADAIIDPVSCASGAMASGSTLALTVPPALSAACPDALRAMIDAVGALHPPTAKLAPGPYSASRSFAVASWIGVGLALLATLVAVLTALWRGAPER